MKRDHIRLASRLTDNIKTDLKRYGMGDSVDWSPLDKTDTRGEVW